MPNPVRTTVLLTLVAAGSFAGMSWLAASEVGSMPRPERVAGSPAFVELFTSQGCSSCPPADAALERMARDPALVAISRPVTYWDRLGWKDTLAREANTRLQRNYMNRKIKGSGVFTPQVVVQGSIAVIGSREAEIRQLAERLPGVAAITVGQGGRITVSGKTGLNGSINLIALKSSVDVAIGRGENGGRKVRYSNVVLDERPIGEWKGGTAAFVIPPEALKVAGADRYAVIIQRGSAGKVLGARYL